MGMSPRFSVSQRNNEGKGKQFPGNRMKRLKSPLVPEGFFILNRISSDVSQKFFSYIFNRCSRFLYLAGPIEGGLFRRPQHLPARGGQDFQRSWNAPKPVIRGLAQAEKASSAQAAVFWGCAG